MKLKLSYILSLIISASIILCSCSAANASDGKPETSDTDINSARYVELGWEYIDSFIFIGESTTAHLKSRGVLSGGTETKQVWSPKNATVNLDTTTGTLKIVYPETQEEISIGEAAKRKRPQRVMLTFGLNGAVSKIKKGEKYFTACYLSLINVILENSPDTEIFIHSCFPIAADMNTSAYSVDARTLNGYISTLNGWAKNMASEHGYEYIDTWEVLVGNDGFLLNKYHVGDGHHLTAEAYLEMLEFIRTHAKTEDI
ncbi:MAG: hypothetical protein IJZ83_05770 [Clostridia bacterium]|nr:hypothetical protein [Clostridia bacterium]